ncbi:MAG: DNA protecting protein DprA [Omnitrophica WOR_2 bacterium GWF2_38_59]|nr:MAG: DNA protecting protein DprA [Omnitrophica WOR_2 bacterium GWF2_38_59]OGX47789.1 MAG: DNA protecting protein DprA [Omnitrophica WOR_2 bacterium RIFOXYA2_FULL_38_17]OGX52081.1 MAG: DNA protecting protein DprA [Omnitrophica WOR_2 bacterium RIFOXYA12_FULL_38_10]OGX56040.1 MAG: DNA protecting protein DprA [Omnitrophica WOR_2 bacterium RIFOXYB2_FULL_38_16]OGX56944.1 MAG: DNA protecting protein DprA [Omnitrophica WOR_2 bacterium RIFOXYC2_FULL_38_12]HBG60329.1 DNA-protecting protein DprA [Cand
MNENDALLVLNAVAGIGNAYIKKLIAFYGSALKVFSLKEAALLEDHIIPAKAAANILNFPKDKFLKNEYNLINKKQVRIITALDSDYPSSLRDISDAPFVLYVKGNIPKDHLALGFVGSRKASIYGMNIAENFALRLAELGITIVSGMARGIDTASHRGSLKAKGRTIAALGNGLANVYPPENKKLFEEISQNGAVVSEFPMETQPLPQNFPRRNRIISGLSLGVVVIEAAQRSGALITADFALEQGKEVYAIPGKVDSPTSAGVNNLIKQGAKLVTCIEDILEDLSPQLAECLNDAEDLQVGNLRPTVASEDLGPEEKKIMDFIGTRIVQIDDIVDKLEIDVKRLAVVLLQMELKRLIRQLPGKNYKAV